jgi:cytochrome c oxidase subunit 2
MKDEVAAGAGQSVADSTGGLWMPPEASTFAADVDGLYYFILYLCTFFFVLMMGLMVYFAVKYRHKGDDDKTSPVSHNFKLEFLWSAIPSVLLIWIFAWGQQDFAEFFTTPNDAMELRVVASQWNWQFTYPQHGRNCGVGDDVMAPTSQRCQTDAECGPVSPDGTFKSKCKLPPKTDWPGDPAQKLCWRTQTIPATIVVPVNKPVKVTMSSEDVLHSFWIPAFRTKKDVLPNRYTGYSFTATKTGTYDIYCAEYCGTSHADMSAKIRVVSQAEWDDWLKGDECKVKDSDGAGLFRNFGCHTCHTVDGSAKVGPSLKGVWGKEETMSDGRKVKVDSNYFRKSLMQPNADIVRGFTPQMPSFAGRIKNETQLNALLDYIRCKPVGSETCKKASEGGKK